MITTIIILTVLLYFVASFIIGIWQTRRINFQRFVAARNTTNFIPLLFTLLGIIVGGGMFFTVGQIGYEAGITGYVVGISYFIGFVIIGFLVPIIRRIASKKNYLTLIDLIEDKYEKQATRKVSLSHLFAFINFLIFFFMLAAQFVVLGIFLKYFFGIHLYQGVMLAAGMIAVFDILIYSVVGGIQKDIATDVLQVSLIILGSIFITLLFIRSSTWSIINTLPSTYFTGMGYGPLFTLGAIIFLAPAFLVRLDMWQRIITAKTTKTAQWAFFAAAPLTLFFYFLFTNVGMYSKAIGAPQANVATLWMLSKLFTDYRYALIIVAFLAAVMSSADTFLHVASISFVKFLKKGLWYRYTHQENPTNEGKSLLRRLRLSTLGIGLSAVIITFLLPNLVDLFISAFSMLLICAPAVLAAIFSEKPNEKAAFHSMLWGFTLSFGLIWFIPKIAFVPGIILSLSIYFVLRRYPKRTRKEAS